MDPEEGRTSRYIAGRRYDFYITLAWVVGAVVLVLGSLGIICYYLLHKHEEASWLKITAEVFAPGGIACLGLGIVYAKVTGYTKGVDRRMEKLAREQP